MTRHAETSYEVIASHHPALESFVLSRWRCRWAAAAHAWLWENILGDGNLWPSATVREVPPNPSAAQSQSTVTRVEAHMDFAIHVDCKTCNDRLKLVPPPSGHEKHLHFRCKCIPLNGALCVSMKATLGSTEDPS